MLLTLSGDLQHVERAFNEDPIFAASACMFLAEHARHGRMMTRTASRTSEARNIPTREMCHPKCCIDEYMFMMATHTSTSTSWTQGKPTASPRAVLARDITAPLSYQRFILLLERAWTHLGILLPCWSWKGPGIGLPVTLKTGLGLLLPEAEARCALSSFT